MPKKSDSISKKAEEIQQKRYKFRAMQLQILINKYGSPKALAAAIGMSRSYVTSLLSRDIGECAARTIESTLDMRGFFGLPEVLPAHVLLMQSTYRDALKGLKGRELEQAFYRMRVQDLAKEYETVVQFGNAVGFNNGHYISLILGDYRPISELTRTRIELLPGRNEWFKPASVYADWETKKAA